MFQSDRDSSEGNDDIFVMNADGSGIVNLTNTDETCEDTPSLSPDGTRIAFASDINGLEFFEIFVMNIVR